MITGASRGIGLAIAQRLVAEGARVCITARHGDALMEAERSFPRGAAIAVAGRVDDEDHREQVLARVIEEFGGRKISWSITPVSIRFRAICATLNSPLRARWWRSMFSPLWSGHRLRFALDSVHDQPWGTLSISLRSPERSSGRIWVGMESPKRPVSISPVR